MKSKKLISILLAGALALSMAACGGEANPSGSSSAGTGSAGGSESTGGASSSAASAADTGSSAQDPMTIKILAPGDAKTADCEEIAAAASKITEEKFNTTLEITRIGFGSYTQEINLMLASGEKMDMFYQFSGDVINAISSGQIVPLGEHLDTTGTDLKEQIADHDWACVTIDGQIYGVPANKEKATGWGFAFIKEMADETGIDYMNIKTEAELEPLLTKIKELYPDVYPVVPHNGGLSEMSNQDELGGVVGCLLDTSTDSTTVENYIESDAYMAEMKLRYEWAQKGLILPDASTNTEAGDSILASGKGFGRFCNTKPGMEQEIGNTAGKEIVILEFVEPFTTTTRVDIVWYVPHNAEDPARSVQVLNEAYTNPELANYLINGIEDKHYTFVDEEKGIIGFPDGVTGTSTGYTSLPWAWPNEMISYIWEGNPEDVWAQTQKFNEDAIVSPAKGFTWDNSAVLNQVTACNNVKAKYATALGAGSLDPETTIPRFLEELNAAGAQDIIQNKQEQLDRWLAENQS